MFYVVIAKIDAARNEPAIQPFRLTLHENLKTCIAGSFLAIKPISVHPVLNPPGIGVGRSRI
jgi:hypothetical protein